VPLSRNLGTLTSWNPLGLSRPALSYEYVYSFPVGYVISCICFNGGIFEKLLLCFLSFWLFSKHLSLCYYLLVTKFAFTCFKFVLCWLNCCFFKVLVWGQSVMSLLHECTFCSLFWMTGRVKVVICIGLSVHLFGSVVHSVASVRKSV